MGVILFSLFSSPSIPDFPTTVVTWELEKMENNKTRLKLLHRGFRPDETAKKHNEGWSHFLGQLIKYCAEISKYEISIK